MNVETDLYEDGSRLQVNEDSLVRTLDVIKKSSFAIFTAYRKKFTKKENILRNRKLRAILNAKHMGVHQLVGHYDEVQANGKTEHVVERSYLVEKPTNMLDKDFSDLIIQCLNIDNETQDCALCRFASKADEGIVLLYPNNTIQKIGTGYRFLKKNDIAQIYSQHVKKMNTLFVFEGEHIPEGCISSVLGYKHKGYAWNGHNGFGY